MVFAEPDGGQVRWSTQDDLENDIRVSGMHLLVLPIVDGVYRVYYRKRVLADLYPEISATGIHWNGFGLITPLLAEQIGLRICAFECSSFKADYLEH